MALGNIKVKRTEVIKRVKSTLASAEKAITKAQAQVETLTEKETAARETLFDHMQTMWDNAEQGAVNFGYRGTLSREATPRKADVTKCQKLEESVRKAERERWTAQHEIERAENTVFEAKRDLALLEASGEDTINVKTAGFLGYFGG